MPFYSFHQQENEGNQRCVWELVFWWCKCLSLCSFSTHWFLWQAFPQLNLDQFHSSNLSTGCREVTSREFLFIHWWALLHDFSYFPEHYHSFSAKYQGDLILLLLLCFLALWRNLIPVSATFLHILADCWLFCGDAPRKNQGGHDEQEGKESVQNFERDRGDVSEPYTESQTQHFIYKESDKLSFWCCIVDSPQ